MIQPQPYTAKCPKCNYVKIVKQKSDVLDITASLCPKCGTFMEKTDDVLDTLTAGAKNLFSLI